MIFAGERNGISHIDMIHAGLPSEFWPVRLFYFPEDELTIKSQTRRWSEKRSVPELYQYYKVGQLYAIQPGRTKPGLDGVKIRITRKWIETTNRRLTKIYWNSLERGRLSNMYKRPLDSIPRHVDQELGDILVRDVPISAADALAEGGYTPDEFEIEFKKLNPKWPGVDRVGLEFQVVRV